MSGLLPLHWNVNAGKLYLEITLGANGRCADLLYTNSLPWGTGSNDLGLDRGQTSPGKPVRFERTGAKVPPIEPNEMFRSSFHRRLRSKRARGSGTEFYEVEADEIATLAREFRLMFEKLQEARRSVLRLKEEASRDEILSPSDEDRRLFQELIRNKEEQEYLRFECELPEA
jgi:hypothetical protein